MQHWPRDVGVLGSLIGLLDLRENLRFADDHAFQAAGNPQQMLHDVAAGERDDETMHAAAAGEVACGAVSTDGAAGE